MKHKYTLLIKQEKKNSCRTSNCKHKKKEDSIVLMINGNVFIQTKIENKSKNVRDK